MVGVDELRKTAAEMPFPLTVLEDAKVRLNPSVIRKGEDLPLPGIGVDLSGSQVLVGFASALCLTGVLIWAVLKLWLFER